MGHKVFTMALTTVLILAIISTGTAGVASSEKKVRAIVGLTGGATADDVKYLESIGGKVKH